MMLGVAGILAQPLMLRPEASDLFRDMLGMLDAGGEPPIQASAFRGKPVRTRNDAPLYNIEAGAAIVSILGPTVNRGAWTGPRWGVTSYEGIGAQLDAALADPEVKRIVLDLDCPGGEAAGAFSLAEKVRAASQRKPVTAFVNGVACSAGYAIACGAQRIVVAPSAIVGSIGVIMVHFDNSGRLGQAGIRPTLIYAGARKVDGSPMQPLSPDAKASLQAQVDQVHALFLDLVAAHRRMSAASVRATDARVFMGAGAVKAGLADAVGTLDDALAGAPAWPTFAPPSAFAPSSPAPSTKVPTMTFPAAQTHPDPVRLSAILGLPEAKGLEASAYELVQGTGSVEAARQTLAGMQKATAQAKQAAIGAMWDDATAKLNAAHRIPGAGQAAPAPAASAPSKPFPNAAPGSVDALWNDAIDKVNAVHNVTSRP